MYKLIDKWSSNDRAAFYGDGVFTTMRVCDGRVQLLTNHLHRLQHDLAKIGLPPLEDSWQKLVSEKAAELGEGVLKMSVSSGCGGRGYARPDNIQPVVMFTTAPVPAHYAQWRKTGIRLGVSPIQLARQPLLAGLKHLNRLEQVLVKQQVSDGLDDVLVCDTLQRLVETSSANVFWRSGQSWYTPSVEFAGVNGVMRNHLLTYFSHLGESVEIVEVGVDSLKTSDSVFICNALMGLVPVRTLVLDDVELSLNIETIHALSRAMDSTLS